MTETNLTIIALFLAYFAIHSLTASLWLKRLVAAHLPGLVPYYRLLFNALAMLLAIPLALVVWQQPGEPLWQWQGMAFYLANAMALLAAIAFLYSLSMYDMAEFWGMRQLRCKVSEVKDMECFKISPFHRYVRHPWYTMLLVILWTRDITTTTLLVYALITLYLALGSRLEERKLIAYHGEVYQRYRERVPGLIPRPWRHLDADSARELLEAADRGA